MIKKKTNDIPMIRRGYKYRLQTTKNHRVYLDKVISGCDELYNRVLRLQIDTYKNYKKYVEEYGAGAAKENKIPSKFSVVDTLNMITVWKKEEEIFKHVPTMALQQTLIDLERAFQNFFREGASRYPCFRKNRNRGAFRILGVEKSINEDASSLVVVKDEETVTDQRRGAIRVPKLGWVYYSYSRPLEGVAKNMTISREGDKYFVSIQTEREDDGEVIGNDIPQEVGIDFGLAPFITLSTGDNWETLSPYVHQQERISFLTKHLKQAKIYGENYNKRLLLLENQHIAIKNRRGDWIQKITTEIARRFDVVYIPDIKVNDFSRNKKSFNPIKNAEMIEKLNAKIKNVKPQSKTYLKLLNRLDELLNQRELYANKKDNREFNKRILDCSWDKFTRILEYKLTERHKKLYKVDVTKMSKYDPKVKESLELLEHSTTQDANKILSLGKEQYK